MPSVRWLEPFFTSRGSESKGGGAGGLTIRDLLVVFDGAGSVLTAADQGDVSIPFPCTILGWVMLANTPGSIEIDIWKDTYANYPPTSTDTITGTTTPAITGGVKASSSVLTGWTTAITAGDTLRFTIISVATITRVTLALTLEG